MNDGRTLESYVQYVYSFLLNRSGGKHVDVELRKRFVGRSGAQPEIDVYYEFERAGVLHRIAFECKDLSRPAAYKDVNEFRSRLQDIAEPIIPIMVSRQGYQDGAEKVARHWGIQLLTVGQSLTSLPQLAALMIEDACLPGADVTGEPFWTLMTIREGRPVGEYCGIQALGGHNVIPLFFSKHHAEEYLERLGQPRDLAVRGLSQRALMILLRFADEFCWHLAIITAPAEDEQLWTGHQVLPRKLWTDYIWGGAPFPESRYV
jgi:hypothetical protein